VPAEESPARRVEGGEEGNGFVLRQSRELAAKSIVDRPDLS